MTSVQPYNITIGEQSAVYEYDPHREIDLASGWNDTYTGSPTFVFAGLGSGTPYRATQYNGAKASLTFQGTAVYMCFTPGAGVSWAMTLNPSMPTREVDATTDPACSQWGATTMAVADSLPYSSYTATLAVNTIPSGQLFAFYGSVVSVSIGVPGTVAEQPLIIDDRSTAWTYNPSNEWVEETDTGAVDGTYMQTSYYNGQNIATATYTATNVSALYVVGMLRPDIGFYTVQMNGDQPIIYNAYDYWTTNQQVLFFAGGLDPTQQYSVQLQNYDTAYTTPAVAGENILRVDAIYLIHGDAPTSTSTSALPSSSSGTSASASTTAGATGGPSSSSSSTSSTPIGAIVGGVIGGVAVLAIFALALVLLLRRRNRAAQVDLISPTAYKVEDEPGMGPNTVPVPYYHGQAHMPVQPLVATGAVSEYGDSIMAPSVRAPPVWAGREKSPAATPAYMRNQVASPPSAGLPSVVSPSVGSPSIVGSPSPTTQELPALGYPGGALAAAPEQSEGYPTELPTYESVRGSQLPPRP